MENFSASGFGFLPKRFLLFVFAIANFVATWSSAGPRPAQLATSTSTPTPAVVSSTYFGGSGDVFSGYDITWTTATDSNGNVYIAGDSSAPDFPVTSNAFQKTYAGGGQDGFVAKFDRYGNLLWSTFLGGTSWDGVYGLAVDSNGNAVVTGVTASSDFPITANAAQKTIAANTDAAFVTVM